MERVVLLDDDGNGIGTADKATVHHEDTPLHLAFSAYLFDQDGRLLLTRRAATKKTWPGVWTNSCCGHPQPGEDLAEAVVRRLRHELGLAAIDIGLILPQFRYHARMPNGVVENELCPVYRVWADGVPTLEPTEVADATWVSWQTLAAIASNGDLGISPWCREQVTELSRLPGDPHSWPIADNGELPPAAR